MGISTCPCGSFRSEHARLGPLNILGCKKMLFMFSLHPVGDGRRGNGKTGRREREEEEEEEEEEGTVLFRSKPIRTISGVFGIN